MRLIFVAALALLANQAVAQDGGPKVGDCAQHADVATYLEKAFKEVPQITEVLPKGKTAYELFISPLGTWTLVEVYPDGNTCFRGFTDSEQGVFEGMKPKPQA